MDGSQLAAQKRGLYTGEKQQRWRSNVPVKSRKPFEGDYQVLSICGVGGDDQAASPHPIVDRSLAKLRKVKSSDIGIVVADGLIKCEIAPQSIDRLAVMRGSPWFDGHVTA
ncbi:hypothetical protein NKL05_14580 [Mesorhizobium sp. C420B]|uniref:hypothetical protein n=1 Tax=Mesorhizobium sp. C420B TaxID=2956835 RepID=UPI0012EB2D40